MKSRSLEIPTKQKIKYEFTLLHVSFQRKDEELPKDLHVKWIRYNKKLHKRNKFVTAPVSNIEKTRRSFKYNFAAPLSLRFALVFDPKRKDFYPKPSLLKLFEPTKKESLVEFSVCLHEFVDFSNIKDNANHVVEKSSADFDGEFVKMTTFVKYVNVSTFSEANQQLQLFLTSDAYVPHSETKEEESVEDVPERESSPPEIVRSLRYNLVSLIEENSKLRGLETRLRDDKPRRGEKGIKGLTKYHRKELEKKEGVEYDRSQISILKKLFDENTQFDKDIRGLESIEKKKTVLKEIEKKLKKFKVSNVEFQEAIVLVENKNATIEKDLNSPAKNKEFSDLVGETNVLKNKCSYLKERALQEVCTKKKLLSKADSAKMNFFEKKKFVKSLEDELVNEKLKLLDLNK